jgi:hypothetical protein
MNATSDRDTALAAPRCRTPRERRAGALDQLASNFVIRADTRGRRERTPPRPPRPLR